MTLFEAAIYGPFYCLVAGAIFRALSPVAEATDRPWIGKAVVALALVLATVAVWVVGNMEPTDDAPALPPGVEIPEDWRSSVRDWRDDY